MKKYNIIILFFTIISYNCFSQLTVLEKFKIPKFKGNTPTNFTDICIDKKNGKLAVCSDGGYGEFPIKNGKIIFSPPGFISSTKNFILRGYVNTDRGLSAVDNKGRFIFYGNEKLYFPKEISGEITGATGNNNNKVIIGEKNCWLSILKIKNKKLVIEKRKLIPLLKLESVTYHNNCLWVTDGGTIYKLNNQFEIEQSHSIPEMILGFCFAKGFVFAVSQNEKYILKLKQ